MGQLTQGFESCKFSSPFHMLWGACHGAHFTDAKMNAPQMSIMGQQLLSRVTALMPFQGGGRKEAIRGWHQRGPLSSPPQEGLTLDSNQPRSQWLHFCHPGDPRAMWPSCHRGAASTERKRPALLASNSFLPEAQILGLSLAPSSSQISWRASRGKN